MTISSPSSAPGVRIPFPGSDPISSRPPSRRLCPRGTAESRLHDLLRALTLRGREELRRLVRRVSQVEQALAGKRARVLLAGAYRRRVRIPLDLPGDLLAELDDDPLGRPLADSGNGLEALRVARGDRPEQLSHRSAREHR